MSAESKIRVVVVDDSAFMREVLRRMLERSLVIEIVGSARNGEEGLRLVAQLQPDVVTMDVEMRGIGGLEALRRIVALGTQAPPVIMVSSLTTEGAQTTLDALEIGAVDFIAKPAPGAGIAEITALGEELIAKVRTFGSRAPAPKREPPPRDRPQRARPRWAQCVGIGTSTGGPVALSRILPRLPKNYPAPIVVAQHMPPGFTSALAERLDAASAIDVCEGKQGMPLRNGCAVIAPAGFCARVRGEGAHLVLALEEPANAALTPSVDALLASVGEAYRSGALGVILTGMGRDGVEGLRTIRARGGYAVGQDEGSCVVFGMPRAAAEAGLIDEVASLDEMAALLCSLTGLEVPLQREEGSRPRLPGT